MGVDFSRIAERYDETRGGEERGLAFAAELAPHLPPGPLLEVGVGTGIVAAAMAATGRQVIGADIAPAMLARARDRLGRRVVHYDGRRLPFAEGSFAAAYAVWVLHLVEDQPAMFAELRRVLTRGGRFLVAPVNHWPDDAINDAVQPMYDALLGPGPRRDDLDRLAAAASAAGLREAGRLPGHAHRHRTSAPEELKAIQNRNGAVLWDVGEERWREVVEPALRRLRALGDLEVEREMRHELLVLERPD